MNTDLTVLTFGSLTGADDMLKDVQELQSADFLEILDAVVVTRDGQGKVDVRQPLEVGPGKGAAFGAVTGAVVGLLGGPAGAVVGLLAGGMTGGAAGAAFESGVPVKEIKSMAVQELAKSIVHEVVAEERKTAREAAHEKAAAVRKAKIEAAYQSWQARLDG